MSLRQQQCPLPSDRTFLLAGNCIGLRRRALLSAICCRQLLDTKDDNDCWAKVDREPNKDSIPKDVELLVTKWYLDETITSPNMDNEVFAPQWWLSLGAPWCTCALRITCMSDLIFLYIYFLLKIIAQYLLMLLLKDPNVSL